MKSLLILLSIVALVFSAPVEETNDIKDYIEIVKCFLDQQPLIDDVNSIVEMIKTQDFSQAITLLFKAYGDVQAAISKCIPSEIASIPLLKDRACFSECRKAREYQKKLGLMSEEEIEKHFKDCIDYCEKYKH